MSPWSRGIDLAIICAFFILLSIGGIIWEIRSGLLTSGIDGIMLLAICLMAGGIFGLMLLVVLHQAGLLPSFRKSPAKDAAPATQPASQGK
ncbi:MAG: hypothetical protein WBP79_06705 [Candidatus Acidiferrales bacterium]